MEENTMTATVSELQNATEDEVIDLKRKSELLDSIRRIETEVSLAETEWLSRQEAAKDAKKRFDAAVSKLRFAVRETNQLALPFTEPEEPGVDAWREVPIESLNLSGTIVAILHEQNLSTLGAVADFTASGSTLTNVTGIGPASADKIEEALTEFWSDHPEYAKAEAEVEGDDGGDK